MRGTGVRRRCVALGVFAVLAVLGAAAPEAAAADDEAFTARVVDEAGRGLADVRVREVLAFDDLDRLLDVDVDWDHGGVLAWLPEVASGADGRVVVEPWVAPWEDEADADTLSLLLDAPGRAVLPLELEAGDDPRLVLHPEGWIEGRAVSASGAPLAGVHVCLTVEWFEDDDGDELEFDAELVEGLFCTASDDAGRFRVGGLPSGSVWVELTRPLGETTIVEDVAVERGVGVSVGDVVLPGGRELRGQVVDADGRPLAGARVVVRDTDRWAAESVTWLGRDGPLGFDDPLHVADVVADAEGRFAVGGLEVEAVDVFAAAAGFEPGLAAFVSPDGDGPVLLRLEPRLALIVRVRDAATGEPLPDVRVDATVQPGWTDEDEQLLEVLAGEAAAAHAADVPLEPGDRLVLGARADGTVLDVGARRRERRLVVWNSDEPAAVHVLELRLEREGALRCQLEDGDGNPLVGVPVSLADVDPPVAAGWRPRRALTNASGVAWLRELPAGSWRVRLPWRSGLPDPVVEIEAGKRVSQEVSRWYRSPAGSAGIDGVLTAPSGAPVPGVALTLKLDAAAGRSSVVLARARTDAQGVYAFDDLAPGIYRVSSGLAGDTVVVGRERARLDLVARGEPARVGGRLLLDGEPVSARDMRLQVVGERSASTSGITSAAGGRYDVLRLASGEEPRLELLITASSASLGARGDLLVLVAPGETIERDLELRRLDLYVEGRVVHADTGEPVAGEPVHASLDRKVTTDADGRFRLGPLMPGHVTLSVRQGGWLGTWRETVYAPGPHEVLLRLPRLASLEGEAEVPNSWPLEARRRVKVVPRDDHAPLGGRAEYQAEVLGGRYRLDALPVGDYRLVPAAWSLGEGRAVYLDEHGLDVTLGPEGVTAPPLRLRLVE